MNAQRFASLLLLGTLGLAGCKPDSALRHGETLERDPNAVKNVAPANTNAADVGPGRAGMIVGTVHFKGTAPKRVKIDMSMDPACAMSGGDSLTDQYVVDDGKLANVYVYIKAGAQAASVPAGFTVTLDQKGCRYVPHVIALQQGGSVVFKNSDPTMHNVHIIIPGGDGGMDMTEAPLSGPQSQQFGTPSVMTPVRCNNHPWMSAFINVSPTPYFAVTGPDGKFTIQGLPPGKYTLAAVHEKLGEQDVEVTVAAKATEKSDFTFTNK